MADKQGEQKSTTKLQQEQAIAEIKGGKEGESEANQVSSKQQLDHLKEQSQQQIQQQQQQQLSSNQVQPQKDSFSPSQVHQQPDIHNSIKEQKSSQSQTHIEKEQTNEQRNENEENVKNMRQNNQINNNNYNNSNNVKDEQRSDKKIGSNNSIEGQQSNQEYLTHPHTNKHSGQADESQKNFKIEYVKDDSQSTRKSKELPPLVNVSEKFHKTGNSTTSKTSTKFSDSACLGKVLGDMKRNRKQAELEAAVLSGRIALLKQEEINSKKKIYQTKKQTFEYYILKKSNEQEQNKKQKQEEQWQEKQRQMQEDNERYRLQKRDDRENARQTMISTNKFHYGNVKKQMQENEERRKLFLERHIQENQKKKVHIQQQLLKGSMHISEFRNKQNERQLDNYRKQIEEEESIKQQKQYEIYQMEQLELNLIKKLQATQQLQRKCFEELQGVITLKTEEFQSQYKPVFSHKRVHKLIMSQTQSVLKQDGTQTDRKINTHQSLENLGIKSVSDYKKNGSTVSEGKNGGDSHSKEEISPVNYQEESSPIYVQDTQKESSHEGEETNGNQSLQNTQIQQEQQAKQSQQQIQSTHTNAEDQEKKLDQNEKGNDKDKDKKRKKSKLKKRHPSTKKQQVAKQYQDFVF